MHSINPHTFVVRHVLAVLCISVLLTGCGLASRNGSVDAGLKYQANGEYRAAYIEAKKVLQRDNKNGDAWLLLGQASLRLGNPKDALSDLESAKANNVSEERWAVPMGQALLATGQYDQLLKTLAADRPFEPKVKARVAVLRGDAYRGLGQLDQARTAYQAALTSDSKSPGALVGLAKLESIAHDANAASNHVQQALAAAPDNPQALVAKADLAFESGDLAGAEATYQKVLGFKNPDWLPQERFYALTRLANAQAQQNQLDKALANIQTLEKMSPQQPYPYYLHAVVLYKQGHMDDAIAKLQQVLKLAPDNAQAQMLMGAVSYAQGNYAQTEMYLSNVMGMDQKNVDARKLLALTYYREGRSRSALDTLRPAVPGTPTDAELTALLQRATTSGPASAGTATPAANPGSPADAQFANINKAFANGNASEAIAQLQKIPAGDDSTEARRNSLLVMAYIRDKRPAEAAKVAAAYAAKNPRNSSAHLLYGTALIAAGERGKARTQYSEALKLDANNLPALLSLGSLDSLEGHYKDAVGRYDAVLKADPKNVAAMTALGQLAMLQGDKAGAIKWFKQSIDAAPKSIPAYVSLLMLYSENGQFEDAGNTAKQMVAANPDNPAALNALGAAQLNAGHHSEALQPLQHAVKLAPQVPLYRINLARAQILGKDTKGAEDNLDAVLRTDPQQVAAVAMLASLKLQNHDMPGAIALAQTLQKQPATKAAGFALEGDLHMANKFWPEAVKAYQQGLKIQHTRPMVIKTFQALSESGAREPETVLKEWLAKNPDDAATRLQLADYYLAHTQTALAANNYEQILKAHPNNIGALNNLAWVYTEQNNPKALALAERAYKMAAASPGVADTYAWALISRDQPKTALPILQQAAKAAPKAATIQYHLAVAQARTGDRAGARSTLESLQKSGADFPDKQAAEKLYHEIAGATGRNAGR